MPQALAGSIGLFLSYISQFLFLSTASRLYVTRSAGTSSFSPCKQFFQGNPDSGNIRFGLITYTPSGTGLAVSKQLNFQLLLYYRLIHCK